jgi:hypothetical protein
VGATGTGGGGVEEEEEEEEFCLIYGNREY